MKVDKIIRFTVEAKDEIAIDVITEEVILTIENTSFHETTIKNVCELQYAEDSEGHEYLEEVK